MEGFQAAAPVACHLHLAPGIRQVQLHQSGNVRVVLDDEDVSVHGWILLQDRVEASVPSEKFVVFLGEGSAVLVRRADDGIP